MSTEQSRLYNFQNDSAGSVPISSSKVDAELNQLITALNKKVLIKSSAPSSPSDGQTWIDISTDPPTFKIYDQTNAGWTAALLYGGFSSYTEKTVPVDDDLLVINDSAASNAAKRLKVSNLRNVANDTYIKAKNAAGSGTVNLIKANSSDIPVISDTTQTATNAAPSDAKGVANKKYVDDQIDALTLVGSPVSKTIDTIYQAATDGIVSGWVDLQISEQAALYSDSSNPPTTKIQDMSNPVSGTFRMSFCSLIKKNDFYKLYQESGTISPYTLNFTPLTPQ